MKISVIGAGKWGSALFGALSRSNDCVLSSRRPREVEGFVPLEAALEAEHIVLSVATQHVREFLEAHPLRENQKILVASKGVEIATGKFLHEIFAEFAPLSNLSFLSGPSFATEVARGLPCALVVSGFNSNLNSVWADAFPPFIKAYVSEDVVGSEVCGAYKNVVAIAGGVCEGLGLGANARASLIARGLVEMHRFGKFFGAKDETFLGLSGAGDLFLTANSEMSRNFRVGLGLAKGEKTSDILAALGEVAEGVPTAFAIKAKADENGIYAPIAREVCAMIDGKDVRETLKDLLKRNG